MPGYLTSLGRNITAVCLIQWVIIGWTTIALGVYDQPSWVAALLGVPLLVTSHPVALWYDRIRRARRATTPDGDGPMHA